MGNDIWSELFIDAFIGMILIPAILLVSLIILDSIYSNNPDLPESMTMSLLINYKLAISLIGAPIGGLFSILIGMWKSQ